MPSLIEGQILTDAQADALPGWLDDDNCSLECINTQETLSIFDRPARTWKLHLHGLTSYAHECLRYGLTYEDTPAWITGTRCNWGLSCTNQAIRRRRSPGAGLVPICDTHITYDNERNSK